MMCVRGISVQMEKASMAIGYELERGYHPKVSIYMQHVQYTCLIHVTPPIAKAFDFQLASPV